MNIHQLKHETAQAEALRTRLADAIGDDEDARRDLIDGETSLIEMVNAAVAQIGADEAIISGVKTHMSSMRARVERIEARIDTLREALADALTAMGVKTHQAPTGTITLAPAPPKVVVLSADEVPDDFWKQQPPVIDLATIRQHLKDGLPVPGALLSNGGMSVRIRRA